MMIVVIFTWCTLPGSGHAHLPAEAAWTHTA
jgi:hypothetical protein